MIPVSLSTRFTTRQVTCDIIGRVVDMVAIGPIRVRADYPESGLENGARSRAWTVVVPGVLPTRWVYLRVDAAVRNRNQGI